MVLSVSFMIHLVADSAKMGLTETRLAIIPGGGEWSMPYNVSCTLNLRMLVIPNKMFYISRKK